LIGRARSLYVVSHQSNVWSSESSEPIVDILADPIPRVAIALLDLTFELLASPIDGCQVRVGDLGPFVLDLVSKLLPVSCNAIPRAAP
jgi:hypothetical protein